tara:strand:- start:11113 stop:11601 length:489 start_codon:yes stop_codon:yes gene_type:complete
MVAISLFKKAWTGFNLLLGKADHIDAVKNRIDDIIHNDSNIMKYNPDIYYESRIKSFERIVNKIKNKKKIPKDIYGIRIVYNSNYKNDEYIAYYIKYAIDKEFRNTFYCKDYIVNPKKNGYKSLHLGVWDHNCLYDIQIRNVEMDYWAKHGGASDYYLSNQE